MRDEWPFRPMNESEIDQEIEQRLRRRDLRIRQVRRAEKGTNTALIIAGCLMFILFWMLFRLI